tara:strand:+ start:180 stop:299 length:120 start_codon:yes stop_codon:yes gene_type:complete
MLVVSVARAAVGFCPQIRRGSLHRNDTRALLNLSRRDGC